MPVEQESITIQGHRGCRGVLPENSLKGFLHAIDLGVTTLEMDVVITGDDQVLISHEPFMSGEICSHPDGALISAAESEALQIYSMRLDSVQQYPCGHFPHERFPDQKQAQYAKPTLKGCLKELRAYCVDHEFTLPELNIELKNREEWYDSIQPQPDEYARLVLDDLKELNWESKVSLQSFDLNILKALKQQGTSSDLVCLNEREHLSPEDLFGELGFVPEVYSPYFPMVDQEMIDFCDSHGVTLSVWTVNEEEDLRAMMKMGIRDIITDYPERAISVAKDFGLSVR